MKDYIVEEELVHSGYKCVVVMQNSAHRCGYVGVPKGHPLYGKSYNDHLNVTMSEMEGVEIGKRGIFSVIMQAFDDTDRVRLEAYFDVHGSITFSDGGENSEYPIPSDLWWFGFDCNHAGDAKDYESAKKLFSGDLETIRRIERLEEIDRMYPIAEDVIRTCEYAKNECKSLAEQLKAYAEKHKSEV